MKITTNSEDSVQSPFKSGFVTLIGRPNVGKSTLINAIMQKKLAITSKTAQTTRHRFRAVLTREDFQLILVDTPGLHKPHDALGEELNTSALKALEDVDVVGMVLDATQPVGKGDRWVASHLTPTSFSKMLIISKADLVKEAVIKNQIEQARNLVEWDDIVVCSGKTFEGVEGVIQRMVFHLPEGPQWFPSDMEIDQPLEVIIAEFVREKILRSFRQEVPHAIGVQVDTVKFHKKKKLYSIQATIYTERESQKGMIIGKGGRSIKRIGSEARADLEHLLGARVFLDLAVKVKKSWRKDATQIRRFGYGVGG